MTFPDTTFTTGTTITSNWLNAVNDKCLETVSVKDFGAVGNGVTDDTIAIRNALATGNKVVFPKGDYVVTGELEITTVGQIIEFENTGGYGGAGNPAVSWTGNTRIIAKGTFAKRIRTRRLYRASSSDPQDAPLSVVINIQAEGVILNNVCVWLNCDYSNTSPTNLGDDCDVGVFVGTRVGIQMHNLQVIGYFRRAGLYLDVSGAFALPRFNSLAGTPYPNGVKNGGDGTHLYNPHIWGARVGLAVLGALPKPGQTTYTDPYYDELLGSTVTDSRGSIGFSDFLIVGGRIFGPEHHSNRRLKDPVLDGGVVNETSMNAEPDNAPAAMHISGLAGNASGKIWGMRFLGTRFATWEAFRVRLNYAARVSFYSTHIEGRSGAVLDTAGNSINSNDYTTKSYGDIAATDNVSGVRFIGSVRQSPTDGAGVHFYGEEFTLETDSGRYFISPEGYLASSSGDLNIRAASGSGILFREKSASIAYIDTNGISLDGTNSVITASGNDLDIRSGTGKNVLMRVGNATRAVLTDTDFRLANTYLNFGNGTSFPTIRVGSNSPEGVVTAVVGSLFLRTNGGANTTLYVKESGTGNTGWVAK